MTIIYLLHEAVAVGSKRFEVTYSRDSLLIKLSSSSSLTKEFRLILDSSLLRSVSISLAGDAVAIIAAIAGDADDDDDDGFPNVYVGNCVTKIIGNNKTKVIIA